MDNQFAPQRSQVQPQQQPIVNQPQQQLPSRRSTKLPLLLSLFFVFLIGALYGVYAWQHSKNAKLNAQISSLQAQAAEQAAKTSSLTKQLSQSNKSTTQTKTTVSSSGPFDQTTAITQAVKAYKDNTKYASQATVAINGVTASGNAAYGTISLPGGGGGAWLAINNGGNWSVVSQGQVGICQDQVKQYNLPSIWAENSKSVC